MKSIGRADESSTSRIALGLEWLREWLFSAGFWQWTARVLGIGCVGIWVAMIWGVKLGEHTVDEFNAAPSAYGIIGGIGTGLVSFAFLVAGAVLLAPSLVPWVASPLLRFAESIYLGSHAIERPPLTYEVAERRIREHRWQDAAAEFERIAYWHPTEERAWSEAIRCAELAGDTDGAAWLKRRARLRCPSLRLQPRRSG